MFYRTRHFGFVLRTEGDVTPASSAAAGLFQIYLCFSNKDINLVHYEENVNLIIMFYILKSECHVIFNHFYVKLLV